MNKIFNKEVLKNIKLIENLFNLDVFYYNILRPSEYSKIDIKKSRERLNKDIDNILMNERINELIRKNSEILSNIIIRFFRKIISIFYKEENKIEDIRKNKKIIF